SSSKCEKASAISFYQTKERTERFHVQSSLFRPNIRLGISVSAYPNGITSNEAAFLCLEVHTV
ncbi:hypothetical protein, partial [Vibrio ouci]|uniref:hypothetical protein n=1 Tax=Vibrio ouci TaxID=2499078 RepID=UPI001ABF15D9